MHAACAALHAETRAAYAGDGDGSAHFKAAYALAGGRNRGFHAAALHMDDGVRQRSTFELAQARQLDRTAGGQDSGPAAKAGRSCWLGR
ncbi:hypothetical protein G6F60_015257 [Rhizopus arrhizus]|nr:hypothetical protein G6F60_015257 [Rhizopus arrhizus]